LSWCFLKKRGAEKERAVIKSGTHIDGNVFPGLSTYPERDLLGIPHEPALLKGIAISGGGTRSASMAAGQLRALIGAGRFNDYRYLTMISGGSWGTLPLFYLQNPSWIDRYLGPSLPPGALTLKGIASPLPGSVAHSASNAYLIIEAFGHLLEGYEAYSDIIGQTFLKPAGIDENAFFTWNNDTRALILGYPANAGKLTASDFQTVLSNLPGGQPTPFPIVGGTLMRRPQSQNLQFEMTPLYTGVSGNFPTAGLQAPGASSGQGIGDGSIAPHLFGTGSPSSVSLDNVATSQLSSTRKTFSLRDVIGVSGCAPRAIMELPWFPNYDYWSPTYSHPTAATPQKEAAYDFGDGGIIDNYGIMPLLRRGCTRIVILNNTEADISQLDLEHWMSNQATLDPFLDDALAPLFISAVNAAKGNLPDQNIVFDNTELPGGVTPLVELVTALRQSALDDGVSYHRANYKVLPNPNYGITSGYVADITWVFTSLPKAWESALPKETFDDTNNRWRKTGAKPFPFVRTFEQNFPTIVNLTPEEAGMLGHLAEWIVTDLIGRGEI
jgi:hypothetical protein